VADSSPIGEYLKARRELVAPEAVGIEAGSRRRVRGLRREEVARIAGVSFDYYTRLEQGRERHPSPEVLGAIARALMLDADASAHLRSLAETSPVRRRRSRVERPPAGIERLLDSWGTTPAYIQGRHLDVLAVNALAAALAPYYRVGVNLLRAVFVEEQFRDGFEDWDHTARGIVAALRARIGPDLDDPVLAELVGDLSLRSEKFRQLWARHDAGAKRRGASVTNHPLVGRLELNYEKLPLPDTDGQILVALYAAPGSLTAHRLAVLAATTVTQ
jgi:transcriptional regulator with XRE-family HTH domain